MVPVFKKSKEPAERAAPGWLRSKFRLVPYPRPGVAPCGRATCDVCGPPPIQCEELQPEPAEKEDHA